MTTEPVIEAFPGAARLVSGPIARGCWLLTGPPGAGKSVFIRQFLKQGLEAGDLSLLLLTEEAPRVVEHGLQKLGLDPAGLEARDTLRIVDCYSAWSGDKPGSQFFVPDPMTLTNVSITLETAIPRPKAFRFAFDSITPMAVSNQTMDTMFKFLQVIAAKVRRTGGWGFFSVQSGVHPQEFEYLLKFLFDGVLEIRLVEEERGLRRLIRIYSMKGAAHQTAWAEFAVTDAGLQLL